MGHVKYRLVSQQTMPNRTEAAELPNDIIEFASES